MFYSTVVSLLPASVTVSTETAGLADPATNEVTEFTVVGTGGTYTVTALTITTDPISPQATEAELQAIFTAAYGAGNAAVTVTGAGVYEVEWTGDNAATDITEPTASVTNLANGIALPESRGNSTSPVQVALRPATGDLISIGGSADGCNYPLLNAQDLCFPVTVAHGPVYAEGDGDLYVFMSGLDQTPV